MTDLILKARATFGPAAALATALPGIAAAGWCVAPSPAAAQSAASVFTTGYRWDPMRRLVGKISPSASTTSATGPFLAERYTYDADGQLIRTEKGSLSAWQQDSVLPKDWSGFTVSQAVELTYDAAGNKINEAVKVGSSSYRVTRFEYDANDRLICSAVRLNLGSLSSDACALGSPGANGPDRVTKNVYDAAGQLLQVRKGVGTTLEQAYTTYSYTPNGKQEYVIDANGNRGKLEYDGFDRQVKWTFPSTAAPVAYNSSSQITALATAGALNPNDYEQYGYDPNGNRTSLRKRDGSTLTYSYDALNRITVKSVPERSGLASTHTRDVFYAYDLQNHMIAARFGSDSGEGISTDYDGAGRVSSSTVTMEGASRSLSYQYDADNNRTRVTYPDGGNNYITYAYDGLDRPSGVSAVTPSWSHTYSYNPSGDLITDTISGGGGITSYGRDPIGRLSSLALDLAGTSADIVTTFTYNPASQITQEVRGNAAYAYTGQVNVNRTYTPNGLNQYSTVAGKTFCHDANGNLTGDGAYVYLYDVENRLVEKRSMVGTSCTNYAGTLLASFRYDPMGRLYETNGPLTALTRYLIDGDALVAEYDSSGAMLRRYVHGAANGVDDPIAWYEGGAMNGSSLRFLHANHQGSIVLAGDSAGNAARIFRFDEYGIPQSGDGASLIPSNGARFLYTGQSFMPDAGMYYYKARMYSPTLGRFLQTDPIGYKDQVNLYAYVANDPVNRGDPTGTETVGQYFTGIWNDLKDAGEHIAAGDFEYFSSLPPTLGGGVISEGMAGVNAARAAVTELRGGAQAATVASQRAAQIHSVLDPIAQSRRTTAVLETSAGRIVAGGGRDLTAAQRATLGAGETAARAPGAHAEVTALRQATANGATPQILAASRPICSSCAAEIRNSGGTLTSPTTATWEKTLKSWWPF